MAVVVDASVLVTLVADDPRAPVATALIDGWLVAGETLHAPSLGPYEVASAITRLVGAGLFPADRVGEAWEGLMTLPVSYHRLELNGGRVVEIALQLRRRSAYDAAYLALAEDLNAELWTFDAVLVRNAGAQGHQVHLAG